MNPMRCLALTAASLVTVATAAPAASLSIKWTAPGDDGMTGRAAVYELRFSKSPITAANYAQGIRIPGLPVPAVAGTPQSFVVAGLPDTGDLYLAIKTSDDVGNWSLISNVLKRPAPHVGVDSPTVAAAISFSSPWPNPARSTCST